MRLKPLALRAMSLSDKKLWLFSLIIMGLSVSCSQSKNMHPDASHNNRPIEFTEERRLNHAIDLAEATVIRDLQELTRLYGRLEDPSTPRSAPIPFFDEETESVIVLKPVLENDYGDIQVENMEESNGTLTIYYREIENWEYRENKLSNPIVILRVSTKPSEIKLNKIN